LVESRLPHASAAFHAFRSGAPLTEVQMPKFLFIYSGGGPPSTPEEGQNVMAAWMAYFQKLGPAVIDGGAPLGLRRTVGGSAQSGATGYSIIEAASLEDAVKLCDGHPHIAHGGGAVEVCEAVPIG